ncbi:hypothetical protein [Kurthia sp. Dielmo]|uniref:hypothetical protein n=1 Tax=Kurthia sp. Dielmo TaxID=1033738 RepID=UPI0005CC8406|nr:hypothetical protein [Kurthia sp. Dielmo]
MLFSFNSLVCNSVEENEEGLPEIKGIFTEIKMDKKEESKSFAIVNIGSVAGEGIYKLVTVLRFNPKIEKDKILMARIIHERDVSGSENEPKNIINIINIPNKKLLRQEGTYTIELYKVTNSNSIDGKDVFDIIDGKRESELLSFYSITVIE